MADCFISYKREDEARVAPVVQSLRDAGLTVWWDRDIPGGEQWRDAIVSELDAAHCVVVCWTEATVGSEGAYVREEAERAKARGVLLPVLLDRVSPPFGFGEVQALDLVDWKGNIRDRRWQHFVATARAIVKGEPRPKPPPRRVGRWAALGGAVVFFAAAVGFINDLSGIQSMLCRTGILRSACRSWGLGGVPSLAEEKAWQLARAQKACDGYRNYLNTYVNGAFAAQAQALLMGMRKEVIESWKPRLQTLPLFVSRNLKSSPRETAARDALAPQVTAAATRTCKAYENSDVNRLQATRPIDQGWRCEQSADGWRCGFDGEVSCELQERTTTTREVCG